VNTLSELYRQRAQQLRDRYDYIVLMYSGGADCQNILDTFVNNDIKLDEVASYVNYEATGDKNNFLNAEIFNVAAVKMQQYPDIYHRLIDLTELTVEHFAADSDWFYDLNMFFNPNSACRKDLALKVKDWANMIHQGKNLCVLWGMDKPRILHINNKFITRFIDFIDSGPTVKSISGGQPYTDELFYWSPDLPEIVIKQSHLIKNYLNSSDLASLPFVSTEKSDLAFKEIDGTKYWLSNHGVHRIIYPTWDISTFQLGKTSSILLSVRDSWFIKSSTSLALTHWRNGVEKLRKLLPNHWVNDPTNFSKGLKSCWSKDYYLE